MLKLEIPAVELFNDETQEFMDSETVILELEHSLVSLSKWESTLKKPFLGVDSKTDSETVEYVKAMTLNSGVPDDAYLRLSPTQMKEISDYINDTNTATWFSDKPAPKSSGQTITAELIYYWMIALSIPNEYDTWHLSRLLTLIKVVNEQNAPKKKISRNEQMARQRQLNEERRKQYNTNG